MPGAAARLLLHQAAREFSCECCPRECPPPPHAPFPAICRANTAALRAIALSAGRGVLASSSARRVERARMSRAREPCGSRSTRRSTSGRPQLQCHLPPRRRAAEAAPVQFAPALIVAQHELPPLVVGGISTPREAREGGGGRRDRIIAQRSRGLRFDKAKRRRAAAGREGAGGRWADLLTPRQRQPVTGQCRGWRDSSNVATSASYVPLITVVLPVCRFPVHETLPVVVF